MPLLSEFPFLTVNTQYPVHALLPPLFFFLYGLSSFFSLLIIGWFKVPLNLVVKLVLPLIGPGCGSVRLPVYLQWLSSRISLEKFAVTLLSKRQHVFFIKLTIQRSAIVME